MKRSTNYPEAPPHLTERARRLWDSLGPSRAATTGRQVLLLAALEALDRAEAAREAIAADGMFCVTKSTGAVHVHPAVRVEREARAQVSKLWAQLGLAADNGIWP